MSVVKVDQASGVLLIGGRKVFPIGFSNPPPPGVKEPGGRNGLAELAAGGATFVRTGIANWSGELIEGEIANERARLDAAAAHGLLCWLWLGDLANLPVSVAGKPASENEQLLSKVVNAFKAHPALGAYKGVDEPRNPFRGANWIRPAGLTRAYTKVKALDPNHPLVIIQAPRSTVAELTPYRPAFDITGADIYPIAYPPGTHADTGNRDICVVGDITSKMVAAAGNKPIWMTLQIAWSGTTPSTTRPELVPRFPTLQEERFMAYQALINGARGLTFFGGHLTQIATPADARAGWNWTFWRQVLKPLLAELRSDAVAPALVAPNASEKVSATAKDIELLARRDAGFFYVLAVRRGAVTSKVGLAGLPPKHDGTPLTVGQVLFEYVQQPLPPPTEPGRQIHRPIKVANGGIRDWFGPHDAHIYRFQL
jgi:hypothetical protein